jgi:pSer/pThr/pTyr-binding forkhead associated (FHA) protein
VSYAKNLIQVNLNFKFLVTIKYNGVFYNLLNYVIPDGQNYVILESLNSIKENQYPLSVHVLMFIEEEGSFILGRGHESDVRISDISVSRTHAKIYFKDKKFYMEDTGSKFGTLVLVKDNVEISDSSKIMQIGRTLLNVSEIKLDVKPHVKKDSGLNVNVNGKYKKFNDLFSDEFHLEKNFNDELNLKKQDYVKNNNNICNDDINDDNYSNEVKKNDDSDIFSK